MSTVRNRDPDSVKVSVECLPPQDNEHKIYVYYPTCHHSHLCLNFGDFKVRGWASVNNLVERESVKRVMAFFYEQNIGVLSAYIS